TNPGERPKPRRQQPRFKHFAGRKGIKVSNQDMEARLMPLDPFEQRPDFTDPPAFSPARMDGAEMQAENSEPRPRGNDLQKRMSCSRWPMPFVVGDLHPAHEPERVSGVRRPDAHPCLRG